MRESPQPQTDIGLSLLQWFRDEVTHHGLLSAVARLVAILWEFLRESMPNRRRQRYGDVDYDWDHRVDTTSATVGSRDRLLGLLHSPYQPTDPALFHEMLDKLNIDFREFVFVDVGSGKGRALLMAADYPFRRIVGVELLPELAQIAQENIIKYKSDSRRCLAVESICGDARDFAFPAEPMVLYLFNPLPKSGLVTLLANLERSLQQRPRPVFVLYHNPLLEHAIVAKKWLLRIAGTHQYAIYIGHGSLYILTD